MALGCKTSLLSFDKFPPAMENYLQNYGFHFSKKAFEWAASIMKKRNPSNGREEEVVPVGKEETSDLLSRYGVSVENNVLYDAAYVATMCKADLYNSSIVDEAHLAKYVKDKLDDPDQRSGYIFVQWYAALMLAGIPISWEDIL